MATVSFGINSTLQLPDDAGVTRYGVPVGDPLKDPASAVRAALTEPIGFPPLAATLVEGDQIAIVLGNGLARTEDLVAGAVLEFLEAGVAPEAIALVITEADGARDSDRPTAALPETIRDQIRVVVHDPSDREQLAMLNISKQNKPIYLNREIVEADVVLPIGVTRPTDSLADLGIHGNVFPVFSDQETQARFAAPETLDGNKREQCLDEAEEAMWYLGTRLVVQVIVGANDQVLHLVAGDTDLARHQSQTLCDAAWRFDVDRRAPLVIATLPGAEQQQTWANVARALDAALRVVDHDGTIAVCCDLKDRPGKSMSRLVDVHSLDAVQGQVRRDTAPDAISASQLIRAMQNANVFLLSQLDEDCVHSLGLAFIAEPDEVARLASRFDSCLLLENAHQALPTVTAEAIS